MAYIAVFHHAELTSPSRWILTLGITGFALISGSLVAISQYHSPLVQGFLTHPLLRIFGKYSYGIYVYHLFIFLPLRKLASEDGSFLTELSLPARILTVLLTISTVFLAAKLSYDVFESRFLRLKRYFPPGSDRVVEAHLSIVAQDSSSDSSSNDSRL